MSSRNIELFSLIYHRIVLNSKAPIFKRTYTIVTCRTYLRALQSFYFVINKLDIFQKCFPFWRVQGNSILGGMYLTRITLSILSNMNFGVTVKSVDWYVNSTTAQGPHDYARCVCQKWVDWLRRNPGLLLVSWTILLNTSNDNVIQTKYRPKFSLPSENICNRIEIHWRTEVIFVNAALYTGVFLISPINSRFVSESRTWRICPARASRDMFPMQWYFCILTEVPCT